MERVMSRTEKALIASAFLLIGLMVLSLLAGCAYCLQPEHKNEARCKVQEVVTDVGKCAEKGIAKLVTQVLPVVILDLVSGRFTEIPNDSLEVLKGQGVTDATVVATCGVQEVDGNLPLSASLSPEHKALKMSARQCLDGGCPWVVR